MPTHEFTRKETEKLTKYKISPEVFNTDYQRLIQAGFSDTQSTSLILRHVPVESPAKLVLTHYQTLLAAPYLLTQNQIAKIANNTGGAKTVQVVVDEYASLIDLGFAQEQIVNIASKDAGANTLNHLILNLKPLQDLGFSIAQITKIAANQGGVKGLNAIFDNFNSLNTAGFDLEQITRIGGNGGASLSVAAVLETYSALLDAGFDLTQISRIAGANGGSKNIYSVHSALPIIQSLQIAPQNIVTIAGTLGGSSQMALCQEALTTLQALGFEAKDVALINTNVAALTDAAQQHQEFRFNAEEIMLIMADDLYSIATVKEAFYNLSMFFTAEQIERIGNHPGGWMNINATQKALPTISTFFPDPNLVVSIITTIDNGAVFISAIHNFCNIFHKAGFSVEQIKSSLRSELTNQLQPQAEQPLAYEANSTKRKERDEPVLLGESPEGFFASSTDTTQSRAAKRLEIEPESTLDSAHP